MTEEAMQATASEFLGDVTGALKKRGLTQRDLAEMLNIKPQQLNAALHFDMRPKSVELRKTVRMILNIPERQ